MNLNFIQRLRRLRYPRTMEEAFSVFNGDNWDMYLFPGTEWGITFVTKYFGDNFLKLSNAIGTMVEGQIISIIETEERNIFEFLIGFEIPAWIILFAVLIIPITLALIDKSFSEFITTI